MGKAKLYSFVFFQIIRFLSSKRLVTPGSGPLDPLDKDLIGFHCHDGLAFRLGCVYSFHLINGSTSLLLHQNFNGRHKTI